MQNFIEKLHSEKLKDQREAIIEISKIDELDDDSIKLLASEIEFIISEGDKALNFFAKKAIRNLTKLEKLNRMNNKKENNLEPRALLKSLKSNDKEVRLNAISALKRFKDKDYVEEALIQFAQSSSEEEAILVVDILEEKEDKNNNDENLSEKEIIMSKDFYEEEKSYISPVNKDFFDKRESFHIIKRSIIFIVMFSAIVFILIKLDIIPALNVKNINETPKIKVETVLKNYFSMINKNEKNKAISRFGVIPDDFAVVFGKKIKWKREYYFEGKVLVIFSVEGENKIFVQKWEEKDGFWKISSCEIINE